MHRRAGAISAFVVAIAAAAALAQEEVLRAADIFAHARERYAAARDLTATFEGFARFFDNKEPRPITGAIAFRKPDASYYEIRFADGPRHVMLRDNQRLRRWKVQGGKVTEQPEETIEGPVEVPFIPAFDLFDETTISLAEVRREDGKPAVYVIAVTFTHPGDPYTGARFGIEDGTWLIRTLDLLDKKGEPALSVRFLEVKLNEGVPEGVFAPPTGG